MLASIMLKSLGLLELVRDTSLNCAIYTIPTFLANPQAVLSKSPLLQLATWFALSPMATLLLLPLWLGHTGQLRGTLLAMKLSARHSRMLV
jgi:hypothetical protein